MCRSGVQPQDMTLQVRSMKKGPPLARCPSVGVSGLNEEDGFDVGLHRILRQSRQYGRGVGVRPVIEGDEKPNLQRRRRIGEPGHLPVAWTRRRLPHWIQGLVGHQRWTPAFVGDRYERAVTTFPVQICVAVIWDWSQHN